MEASAVDVVVVPGVAVPLRKKKEVCSRYAAYLYLSLKSAICRLNQVCSILKLKYAATLAYLQLEYRQHTLQI